MTYTAEILLGFILKAHGYGGAVKIKPEKQLSDNILKMESVFIEIEGKPVPFFIEDIEYQQMADILILKFEGYDSVEKIKEFTGCRVFMTSGRRTNNDTIDDVIHHLTGYKVYFQNNRLLGSIYEIITNKEQYLLNILSSDNKYILIPFHEHFIVNIDNKLKAVYMNIPDGLTEIN